MSEVKPKRLAQAATYFNVSRDEIVLYLNEHGMDIQDNPNAQISPEAFKILNEKYRDEHDLKEESNQFMNSAQKSMAQEEEKQAEIPVVEEKIIAPPPVVEKKEPVVEVAKEVKELKQEPIKIETKAPELSGIKVLGTIDISNKQPSKKIEEKPKEEEVKPIPEVEKPKVEEVAKVEEIKEKEVVKKEQPIVKEEVEEKNQPIEHIETKFQKIDGLKKMGNIEIVNFERKRTKKTADHKPKIDPNKPREKPKVEDDADKKKRTRIHDNEKKVVVFDNPNADKSKFKFSKDKPKDKIERNEAPTTELTKQNLSSPKNLRQKLRKKKRDSHADKAQKLQEQIDLQDKNLKITEFISVSELANLMNITPSEIITFCFGMGLVVSINQRLDAEIIELIASEYDFEVDFISIEDTDDMEEEEDDNPDDLELRAPIVTIMGHVDHGKTSLLDYIRNENVAKKEAGGITQHIGAYDVTVPKLDRKITFIDTPGHEAFTAMRARGAKLTDISIIVIAADDKVMPQTKEAISHSQSANVPMIFAINKIDKDGANPEGVRTQLSEMNLLVESWGGKIQDQEISAKTGQGVDDLLEKIIFEADLLELKANPKKLCNGTVIEASLDKGRGYVATVLVLAGTLNVGDFIVAGANYGKIKAMYNHLGEKLTKVLPGEPVQILGLNGAPTAGESFKEFSNEQEAKNVANKRSQIIREQGIRTKKHITLDEIGRRLALGTFKELNLIIKGDMDGSVQALSDSLSNLSTQEIQVNILHKAVGAITESDVLLASASDAIILGFQVRPTGQAKIIAERESIDIRHYSIIYQAIDEIKSAMEGLLEPTTEEKVIGNLEVRELFKITKIGTIAGCFVTDGKVKRDSKIRVIRNGIVIHSGKLASLKRFKDDVKEVIHGQDCGLNLDNFNDLEVGDILEAYEEVEIKRKL